MAQKSNKKAPVKKTASKKAPVKKKAPAKKPVSKKVSAVEIKIDVEKPQFVNAEKFMKSFVDESAVLIKANDVKSLPLRKKMLAWFKISK
jgi:hypothetical protein